jgi:hypothetical protein
MIPVRFLEPLQSFFSLSQSHVNQSHVIGRNVSPLGLLLQFRQDALGIVPATGHAVGVPQL